MKIEWIRIKGFRNFDDETINFANQTLIIGANDVGKSNLIYALRILFDKSLSENDLELYNSDYNVYTNSDTIEITVKLSNVEEDCLISAFRGHLKNKEVLIQYKNSKDGEYSILAGHSEQTLELKQSRFYIKRLNMEYVNTNRNLESFMKREKNQILEDTKASLSTKETKSDETVVGEIKGKVEEINTGIDNLNYIKKSLVKVNEELGSLAIHNIDQKLSFKTVNSDPAKLLDNLELTYSTENAFLTLGGDGRNNQIFLATWVAKQKNRKTLEKVTFFAIEEPEAHLHPHQQRKLSSYLLDKFDEQVFITTHSPHIASEFKPDSIVKLNSRKKITYAAQGGCSKNIEIKFDDFGYRLDAITSDVFFVNAVFLVEGPSEKLFYTALAKTLNIDLDNLNVSIIPVNGVGFKPYIKVCLALDIPFALRTDNDTFSKTVNKVEKQYQAGISRVMGIYETLLNTSKNKDLIEHWGINKKHNVWKKSNSKPQKALELADYIIQKVKDDNIFLSNIDLENDLVNSPLLGTLKSFYKTRYKSTTVKKMQAAKAENMLKFLQKNIDSLDCLDGNLIAEPLKRIEILAKEVGVLN